LNNIERQAIQKKAQTMKFNCFLKNSAMALASQRLLNAFSKRQNAYATNVMEGGFFGTSRPSRYGQTPPKTELFGFNMGWNPPPHAHVVNLGCYN